MINSSGQRQASLLTYFLWVYCITASGSSHSPPERVMPFSPTSVSSPASNKDISCSRAHWYSTFWYLDSSNLDPNKMLFWGKSQRGRTMAFNRPALIVSFKTQASCAAYEIPPARGKSTRASEDSGTHLISPWRNNIKLSGRRRRGDGMDLPSNAINKLVFPPPIYVRQDVVSRDAKTCTHL